MNLLEAYFDESGSHDGSPVLCVSGYVFENHGRRELEIKWKGILDFFGLPYFHMVDCAHNVKPFDRLSKEDCSEVAALLIKVIQQHALFGVTVSVNEADFKSWFPIINPVGGAYTYCCWQALAGIQNWIARQDLDCKVTYFFEAGHANQNEANGVMNRIFHNPRLKSLYRYVSHAFVDKVAVRPVQAPDILAWLHANHVKRNMGGIRTFRLDFAALVDGVHHEAHHVEKYMMQSVIDLFERLAGTNKPAITGLFGLMRFSC